MMSTSPLFLGTNLLPLLSSRQHQQHRLHEIYPRQRRYFRRRRRSRFVVVKPCCIHEQDTFTKMGKKDDGGRSGGMIETVSRPLAAAARGMLLLGRKGIGKEEVGGDEDGVGVGVGDGRAVKELVGVTVGVALFLLTRGPGVGGGKDFRRRRGGFGGGLKVGVDERRRVGVERFLKEGSFDGDVWKDGWKELEVGLREGWREFEDGLLLLRRDGRDWRVVSELETRKRDVVIVTTAALPWFTGTSVNPLLRAMFLARDGHSVSVVLPWLESPEDQKRVFPKGVRFTSREQQELVVKKWVDEQGGVGEGRDLNVRFYEGVYSEEWGSIFPMGDITCLFRGGEWKRDVCVLEEPEHLTWHHTGERWTKLFDYVVGIVHTNYLEYAKSYDWFGPQRALFLEYLNKWVCRSYCHRVIKLSNAVQELPLSVTCNVHGVRDKFIDIGKGRRNRHFSGGAYFLGKVLWAKGYERLVQLMETHFNRSGERLKIDFFGTGPDLDQLTHKIRSSPSLSNVTMNGVYIDHAADTLHEYKVFVNPSESDVVCTATAEALAMGKFVVCLEHPSNAFFSSFKNCLMYRTPQEFSAMLAYALSHEPASLSDEDAFRLTWEAATKRFYDAARITEVDISQARVDQALAATHKTICSTLVTAPSDNAMKERLKKDQREWSVLLRSVKQKTRKRGRSFVKR